MVHILGSDVFGIFILVCQKVIVKIIADEVLFLVQPSCQCNDQTDQRNSQCNQGNQYAFFHGAHSFVDEFPFIKGSDRFIIPNSDENYNQIFM